MSPPLATLAAQPAPLPPTARADRSENPMSSPPPGPPHRACVVAPGQGGRWRALPRRRPAGGDGTEADPRARSPTTGRRPTSTPSRPPGRCGSCSATPRARASAPPPARRVMSASCTRCCAAATPGAWSTCPARARAWPTCSPAKLPELAALTDEEPAALVTCIVGAEDVARRTPGLDVTLRSLLSRAAPRRDRRHRAAARRGRRIDQRRAPGGGRPPRPAAGRPRRRQDPSLPRSRGHPARRRGPRDVGADDGRRDRQPGAEPRPHPARGHPAGRRERRRVSTVRSG